MKQENYGIRTSLNVRGDLYQKLEEYSESAQMKLQDVMRIFIEKMVTKLTENNTFHRTSIQYQPRASVWEKPHITFSEVEFDRFLDIKKVYRFSLSYILAMALEEFDISILFESEDSYPYRNYTKILKCTENQRIYTFTWKRERKNQNKPPG